jgi:hypothetical protein
MGVDGIIGWCLELLNIERPLCPVLYLEQSNDVGR